MANDDGLVTLVSLFGAMANGPSNSGSRADGKICTAQGGECRFNNRYYSLSMRDAKSWQMPCADDTCSECCPYLQETGRDMGSSEERQGRVGQMINGMAEQQTTKELTAKLLLASLGVDL